MCNKYTFFIFTTLDYICIRAMPNKKVGVIAGTLVDTQMGIKILGDHNIIGYGSPISISPLEQTQLQYLCKDELNKKVMDSIDFLKTKQVDSIMIYCNSLSSSIDIPYIKKYAQIPLVTPLDIYVEIATNYDTFGLIAANGNSLSKIEKIICKHNSNGRVISYGNLQIIDDIENNISPKQIIDDHSINNLFHIMEKDGAEVIILGCTHFPYLYTNLVDNPHLSIPIFEPSSKMIDKLTTV